MQEGPQSPPGSVAQLNLAVGRGVGRSLRGLWQGLRDRVGSARSGYDRGNHAEAEPVNPLSHRPKRQIRVFGVFLIVCQAIALIVLAASYASVEELTSRSEERRVGKECRSRWSPY